MAEIKIEAQVFDLETALGKLSLAIPVLPVVAKTDRPHIPVKDKGKGKQWRLMDFFEFMASLKDPKSMDWGQPFLPAAVEDEADPKVSKSMDKTPFNYGVIKQVQEMCG